MLFAPILQEVAAHLSRGPICARDNPTAWAYRLADAVSLVRPDWIVSHHDPELEADAIEAWQATGCGTAELIDIPLAGCAPVSGIVELTAVLAKLFTTQPIAVSVTGPVALAGRLAGRGAPPEPGVELLLDLGDVLAELVSEYVKAGASRILVWESAAHGRNVGASADAHQPIRGRLETLGVPVVLCGDAEPLDLGYPLWAATGSGPGALLVPAADFLPTEPATSFEHWWSAHTVRGRATTTSNELPPVLLSDGPVPPRADMALLRAIGDR